MGSARGSSVILPVLLALIAPLAGAPAFAQSAGPSLSGKLEPGTSLSPSYELLFYADLAAPAEATGPVQVTFDARDVARNKFVTRMHPTTIGLDSAPCPAGHQCFRGSFFRDPFAGIGRQSIVLAATDDAGRRTVGSFEVDVPPLADRDNDGLPDMWEADYALDHASQAGAQGENGANGDPDGDGVSNLDEFRQHTNPRVRYQRVFAEASSGDLQPLSTCVFAKTLDSTTRFPRGSFRLLAVGDEGRTSEVFANAFTNSVMCPQDRDTFTGTRIVALSIEHDSPFVAERQSMTGESREVVNASFGVQAPSRPGSSRAAARRARSTCSSSRSIPGRSRSRRRSVSPADRAMPWRR